jgi:hypothetical protein
VTKFVHDLLCESGIAINDPRSHGELLAYGPATTLLTMLLMACLVALALTPVVRAAYRRRVTRLMRFHQIAGSLADTETLRDLGSVEQAETSVVRSDHAEANLIDTAAHRHRRIARGTATALAVFAAGGVFAARVYGLDWIGSVAAGLLAAVIAAGPMAINVRPYSSRRTTLLTLGLLTSAWFIALWWSPRLWLETSTSDVVDEIASTMVVIVGLVVGVAHRTLRALLFPITVVLFVPLLVLFVPIVIGTTISACDGPPDFFNPTAPPFAIYLFFMPLTVIAVAGALRILDAVSAVQRRGIVSDVSMVVGFTLWLMTLLLTWGIYQHLDTQPPVVTFLVCALWVAATFAAYLIVTATTTEDARSGPALLILRVFDRSGRGQPFLDRLQAEWQLIGPVWQIGGPDLAPLNVNLAESTLYLAGRLHELFLPAVLTTPALERRLRRSRARDGRSNIEQLFCFNDGWLRVVAQLMTVSDAILIDVRGFTAAREGIRTELELIAQGSHQARTLAVGDDRTDWATVDRVLQDTASDSSDPFTKVTATTGEERKCVQQLTEIVHRCGARR